MTSPNTPPPVGADLRQWAEKFSRFISSSLSKLKFRVGSETAAENGILLWDDAAGYPVVSLDGEWRQLVIANGFAFLTRATDVTAAASNTAYPIVFDAPAAGYSDGITLGASPNQSRIIFEEGGVYYLTFTAQIISASGSQIDFWFWPRINGVDVPMGATRASLHDNTATKPVTKGAVFTVAAGDYIEAYWATDDRVHGTLEAFPATAFSPATPAVSLSITRIRS
jgi:hypothetical protein